MGAGFIERKGEMYLVRSAGRIENAKQIEGVVIGSHAGTPARVRDLATVNIGGELRTGPRSRSRQTLPRPDEL